MLSSKAFSSYSCSAAVANQLEAGDFSCAVGELAGDFSCAGGPPGGGVAEGAAQQWEGVLLTGSRIPASWLDQTRVSIKSPRVVQPLAVLSSEVLTDSDLVNPALSFLGCIFPS